MQVLQFWSDAHRETSVDVFVTEPFSFDEEYERALITPLHEKLPIRFVSLPTLIRMKQQADRPQDRADIEQLLARKENDAS
jgi:flagellar assembly factor FliW